MMQRRRQRNHPSFENCGSFMALPSRPFPLTSLPSEVRDFAREQYAGLFPADYVATTAVGLLSALCVGKVFVSLGEQTSGTGLFLVTTGRSGTGKTSAFEVAMSTLESIAFGRHRGGSRSSLFLDNRVYLNNGSHAVGNLPYLKKWVSRQGTLAVLMDCSWVPFVEGPKQQLEYWREGWAAGTISACVLTTPNSAPNQDHVMAVAAEDLVGHRDKLNEKFPSPGVVLAYADWVAAVYAYTRELDRKDISLAGDASRTYNDWAANVSSPGVRESVFRLAALLHVGSLESGRYVKMETLLNAIAIGDYWLAHRPSVPHAPATGSSKARRSVAT
jgi:Protein of unknown function (DUF3987)